MRRTRFLTVGLALLACAALTLHCAEPNPDSGVGSGGSAGRATGRCRVAARRAGSSNPRHSSYRRCRSQRRPRRARSRGCAARFHVDALRLHVGDVHRHRGDSAGIAAAAHAADVADERDLGDLRGRRDHGGRRRALSDRHSHPGRDRAVRLDDQHRQRLSDHRPHAQDVQDREEARHERPHSARLPGCDRPVHLLAALDERSQDGAARRVRRRVGDDLRDRRDLGGARHHAALVDHRADHSGGRPRRLAVEGAADRGPAANRSVARVRRSRRRARRHRQVFLAGTGETGRRTSRRSA